MAHARQSWRLQFTLGAALCTAAACAEGSSDKAESEPAPQPLYGGKADPDSVGLTVEQSLAVGAIESELGTLYCTGVVIHPRWLLTAAHCIGDGIRLRLSAADGARLVTPLGAAVIHPELDLALVELLQPDDLQGAGLVVASVRSEPLDDLAVLGEVAVLAGAGRTETSGRGVTQFVEEPVVAMDRTSITVDGKGRSGACAGDSGGPLIARPSAGEAQVVGILSRGSSSCRGIDIYTRVDAQAEWITRVEGQASPIPCDGGELPPSSTHQPELQRGEPE